MKVIFLDMDGVVNTANKDRYSFALKLTYDYDGYKDIFKFDPRTLINFVKLLRFCKENEIGICITSTWRIGTSVEGWNEFIYRHLSKSLDMKEDDKIVIGLTNREHNGIRGLQIIDWLNCNKEVSKYLIVDDEIFDIKDYFPSENILKTHSQSGLTEEKLKRTKSHKVFKYSQVDLQLKEILKKEFKNRTSKQHIKNLYPNFDEWFDKVLKEIEEDNTKREILFFINDDVSGINIDGITILKNTEEEKKICYLYILFYEDVENIFEEIYNYLGIETPLITVEKEIFENKYKNYLLNPYRNLLNPYRKEKERKLKFNLTSIVPDKYIKGKTELIFNEVGKEPIDLKEKSLDEVIKEIIEENLKKEEEIVETMNEETKEDVQK